MTTKVTILDGGLGTALEHELGTDVSESPLWSTRAVINSDQTIVNAHRLFIRAGAKIIETATYQASVPNLVAAGLSLNDAKETKHKAVKLVQQAKALYPETSGSVRIALSLGPFGATLRPTQEFLGYYPPPYGPKAFSELGPNTRSFSNPEEEQEAINALAMFHLDRLLAYHSDPATWNSIDYIAFETVLLKREVKSIRRAILLLSEYLAQTGESLPFSKPWWISFVCPDEASSLENLALEAVDSGSEKLPVPSGIGINCTSLERLPSLIADLTRTIPRVVSSSMSLVLYPNGGEYDTANQSWAPRNDGDIGRWASKFADLLHTVVRDGHWKNVIAGGCCRTNYLHIEGLNQATKNLQQSASLDTTRRI